MSEWKKTYLRDLITIKNGKDHKKLKDGHFPVYGSGGIMRYADSYLYDKESVLLPRKGTLNNIQYATEPFWTVDTCYYTEVNTKRVLPYFLYCSLCKMDIEALNTGSAIPSMTFEKYYSIEISLPSLATQHRIATILSRYDSLIENYQKQIKLLEEAAQRLYKEWFIDFHFPGHENTNIIDGVPEGWEKKKIGEIAKVNANSISKTYPHSIIEYVDLGSVREGRIFEKTTYQVGEEPGRAKRIAKDGDVIWGMVRPNLKSFALVMNPNATEVYSTGFAILSALSVPFTFLYCSVTTDAFVGYLVNCTNGAAYPAVKAEHFINAEITVPTNALLDEFGRITIPMYRKMEKVSTQLRLLTEARDRLLPKLMSGDIEV